jgi:TM2 domain-containing membrane protein YozV
MEQQQADQLILMHSSKLAPEYIPTIRERLRSMDYSTAAMAFTDLKDPTIAIIISVLLGELGIDRFFIGDIGLSIAKLLTAGGCGVWWLIDLFLIMGATRQKNTEKVMQILSFRLGETHLIDVQKRSQPQLGQGSLRHIFRHFGQTT